MSCKPWIVEAGEFYAKVYAETESSDKLTRMSAQCKWGMAKEGIAKATATVAMLNACYKMDPTYYSA